MQIGGAGEGVRLERLISIQGRELFKQCGLCMVENGVEVIV